EPTSADHEDLSGLQAALADLPHLREKHMPGIPREFDVRQRFGGFDQRGQTRHDSTLRRVRHLGGTRSAPSRRMTSPLSILLTRMWPTSAAYSGGEPSRAGCGT